MKRNHRSGAILSVGRRRPVQHLRQPPYLNRRPLAGAAPPGQDPRAAADTQEVLNYVRAMTRGLELLGEIPVSVRLLREVHAVLLEGVRGGHDRPGRFRTEQNYIGSAQRLARYFRLLNDPRR